MIGSESISLIIEEGTPTLSVSSPSNNQQFTYRANINFTATASDPQDGDLASKINWNSNINDNIGSGNQFNRTISIGTHAITVSTIDSDNLTAFDSVNISIIDIINETDLLNNSVGNNETINDDNFSMINEPDVLDGDQNVSK